MRTLIRGGKVAAVAIGSVALLAATLPAWAVSYTPTPSPRWTVPAGKVYAIARSGDTIILGGSFTQLRSSGGTLAARNNLAAISASTGKLLSWAPNPDGEVRSLAVAADGKSVYLGGNFTHVGAAGAERLARVDLTSGGLVSGFTASVSGGTGASAPIVRALVLAHRRLYIGGNFSIVDGAAKSYLAAVDPTTGQLDSGFNATPSGGLYSMKTLGSTSLAIGGWFTQIGGQDRRYLGSVDAVTGAVSSWAPPPACASTTNPCFVNGIAASGKLVFVGVSGPGGRVTAYDSTTGAKVWSKYANGDVETVRVLGGVLYAGGHFRSRFGVQTRSGIATMNAGTGAVRADFAPVVKGQGGIFALLPGQDALRVAGDFTSVDGSPRPGYAEFRAVKAGAKFTEKWTRPNGAAWPKAWARSVKHGSVTVYDNQGRLRITNSNGAYARARLSGIKAARNFDLKFSYRWTTKSKRAYFSVFVRGSDGWDNAFRPRFGYGIQLASNSREVLVQRVSKGHTKVLKKVSNARTVSTGRQWVRLRVSGTTIQFKIWRAGAKEPTRWKYTVHDKVVTGSGQVFLSLARGSINQGAKAIRLDNLTLR